MSVHARLRVHTLPLGRLRLRPPGRTRRRLVWLAATRALVLPRTVEHLWRVHLADQAELLRDAARLRSARAPYCADVRRGTTPTLRAWRVRAAELESCARLDALRLSRRLRACLEAPPEDWPSAVALAEAAQALDPCPLGRIELANACLGAGDFERGRALYESCRRRAASTHGVSHYAPRDVRRAAFVGLSTLAEHSGELQRALALRLRAVGLADELTADLVDDVAAFDLAVACGRPNTARRIARSLRRRAAVRGDGVVHEALARRLASRVRHGASAGARALRRELLADGGPFVQHLCLALA